MLFVYERTVYAAVEFVQGDGRKKATTVEEFWEGEGQIILLLYCTNTYISQCASLVKKYFSNFLHGIH